ncbi:MAG TPA: hypothetical protein VGR70_18370, partial [Stellaceae bacterium]|nr:hypothetical protein [Stellaceae bacterium]
MPSRSDCPRDWSAPGAEKIELTQADAEAVQSLFGIEYVAPMTAAQVETEAVAVAKGSKESRARRWEVAKYLLRRAFRSGRLRTWCFDQTEQPLDSKYWSNP